MDDLCIDVQKIDTVLGVEMPQRQANQKKTRTRPTVQGRAGAQAPSTTTRLCQLSVTLPPPALLQELVGAEGYTGVYDVERSNQHLDLG